MLITAEGLVAHRRSVSRIWRGWLRPPLSPMQEALGFVRCGWIRALVPPLLLAASVAGCVALPISGPSEVPMVGKRFTAQEVAAAAAIGRPRAEVVSILGRPTFELGDLKIAVYPWIENKGDWLILLFGAQPLTTPRTEDWALLVAFDEQERVARAGPARWMPSDSVTTYVRNWAASQQLNTPLPQTGFIASPIPKDKSLIYIFRLAPSSSWKTALGAGASWPLPVALAADGAYVSEMHDETYIALVVEPGSRELLADALPPYRYVERGSFAIEPKKRQPASLRVEAEPNQAYFVQLRCISGTGTIDTTLKQQPKEEALPILQQLRPVW